MILITGITGFLGRNLEKYLKEQNIEYLGVDYSPEYKKIHGKYFLDLANEGHVISLSNDIEKPIDTIIHLAGFIDINIIENKSGELTAGEEKIFQLYKNNTLSCANLINLSKLKKVKHFIFTSSQTIYGYQGMNCRYTEKSAESPIEHYACSKLCCEKMLKIMSKSDMAVTIIRMCGLWGHEKRNEFVTDMIKEALETKSINSNFAIPLPLDVIHVDEVVKAIYVILKNVKHGFNIYNIATGEPCSTKLLADMIAGEIPGTKVIPPKVLQPVITMDMENFEKDFGYIPSSNREYIVRAIGEMTNAE